MATVKQLFDAIHVGDVEAVRGLMTSFKDLNFLDPKKRFTPLWRSCQADRLDIARILIAHRADVNMAGSGGRSPLLISSNRGHIDMTKLLIVNKADVNQPRTDGWTPLFTAADSGSVEIVRMLLKQQANINHKQIRGLTPLSIAAVKGRFDVVVTLVESNAIVDLEDIQNSSQRGHLNITNYLELKHGRFQRLFANENLKNLEILDVKYFKNCYKAQISFPGVEKRVMLKPISTGADAWKELGTIKNLDAHPNVMQFYGVCLDFRTTETSDFIQTLVVNYPGLPLVSYVGNIEDLSRNYNIFYQMALAISHIHSSEFIHRNINLNSFGLEFPGNGDPPQVVLCDFTLMKDASGTQIDNDDMPSLHPNWQFCAPESLKIGEYDFTTDVWMYGLTVWAFLSGFSDPFSQFSNSDELLSELKSNSKKLFQLPKRIPKELRSLVADCCSWNPSKRPSMEEIVDDRLQRYAYVETSYMEPSSMTKEIVEQKEERAPTDHTKLAALTEAIGQGEVDTVRALLEQGTDVNWLQDYKWTPLLEAVYHGNQDIVEALIDADAYVNHADRYEITALGLAAKLRHLDMMKLLVDSNANPHATNYPSWGSLAMATKSDDNIKIARLLTDFDPEAQNATSTDHKDAEIEEFLKTTKFGPFKYGCTMLISAAYNGHLDVAQLLCSYGIDAFWIDREGKSALDYAKEKGYDEVAGFLRSMRPLPLQVKFYSFYELSKIQSLSCGNFGTTFKGIVYTEQGQEVKIVCKVSKAGADIDDWFELQVLRHVRPHRCILSLVGLCMDFEYEDSVVPATLVPFQEGGSLNNLTSKTCLGNKSIVSYARDMAKGVDHLHEHNYAHRDLALRNFLLGSEVETGGNHKSNKPTNVVLADFGLSRPLKQGIYSAGPDTLFPWRWCPTESLVDRVSSKASDVYMLGVSFWELLTPLRPFPSCKSPKVLLAMLKKCHEASRPPPLPIPVRCRKDFREMIQNCCHFEPEKRPTAESLFEKLDKLKDAMKKEEESGGADSEQDAAPCDDVGEENLPDEYLDVTRTASDSVAVPSEYLDVTKTENEVGDHEAAAESEYLDVSAQVEAEAKHEAYTPAEDTDHNTATDALKTTADEGAEYDAFGDIDEIEVDDYAAMIVTAEYDAMPDVDEYIKWKGVPSQPAVTDDVPSEAADTDAKDAQGNPKERQQNDDGGERKHVDDVPQESRIEGEELDLTAALSSLSVPPDSPPEDDNKTDISSACADCDCAQFHVRKSRKMKKKVKCAHCRHIKSVHSVRNPSILKITVKSATDLVNVDTSADVNDVSDPYCVVTPFYEGRAPLSQVKTRIIKDNLNPEWNESFAWAPKYPVNDIEIEVRDWNRLKDISLGITRVVLNENTSQLDDIDLILESKPGAGSGAKKNDRFVVSGYVTVGLVYERNA